jgi:hypothetical protein
LHAMSFNIFSFSLHCNACPIICDAHLTTHINANDCISKMVMLNLVQMKIKRTWNMQMTFCFPCVSY